MRTFWSSKTNNWAKNDAETDKAKKTNLEFFTAKKKLTAERKRLKLVKNEKQFRTFWGSKTNNLAKNDGEVGKKIRTNLENFEAKKQITAQRTMLKLIKE